MSQNAVATKPAKPIDTVRDALGKMEGEFAKVLPKHLTPERLMRVALTACQNTPKLLDCDRRSLFSAIMTCASLGLEPDGILGQAYLVPFGGKVQFIPGYKGLISLARNSGEVSSISSHEVRANDHFDFAFGLDERCEHVPARGDRGAITHFYAVARFKDGGRHFDVMTLEEVEAVRDASQGWKAAKRFAKNGVINSPWATHFVEMGKKTMIRRIAKYLPMSVQKAASLADAADAGMSASIDRYGEVTIEGDFSEPDPNAQIEDSGASKLDQFEERVSAEGGGEVDPETGEVNNAAESENTAPEGDSVAAAATDDEGPDPILAALAEVRALPGNLERWWGFQADALAVIEADDPDRYDQIREAYSTRLQDAQNRADAADRARATGSMV